MRWQSLIETYWHHLPDYIREIDWPGQHRKEAICNSVSQEVIQKQKERPDLKPS